MPKNNFVFHRLGPETSVLVCLNCEGSGEGFGADRLGFLKLGKKSFVFCPNCERREEFSIGENKEGGK